jgi:hypothetical protein
METHMSLGQLASIASMVSAVALIVSVIYVSVQIRHNTRAVRASAFQQVIESFAGISLDIAKDKTLVDLYLRASRDFVSLSEVERAQFSLLLLSFLRRAENVFFQTEIQLLETDHWSGIRESVKAIVTPPGARDCWSTIKSRMNPEFRAFVDTLIA